MREEITGFNFYTVLSVTKLNITPALMAYDVEMRRKTDTTTSPQCRSQTLNGVVRSFISVMAILKSMLASARRNDRRRGGSALRLYVVKGKGSPITSRRS